MSTIEIFLLFCISAAFVWVVWKNQSLQKKLKQTELEKVRLETSLEEQEKQKNFGNLMETKFENLAQKIFNEKDENLVKHNKQQLDSLLAPLKENIQNFQNTFITKSASFTKEIELLRTAHLEISQDAKNLTQALKGDSKIQGNWGEVILERILEQSGLVQNKEYIFNKQFQDDEGKNVKPDVVILLPQNRQIIIDSKVSLTAYETFVKTADEQQKENFLKAHLSSIKRHIQDLSNKSYHNIPSIKSLEFTLMFIPIEPALYLAVEKESNLYQTAFRQKILLVSPSTLMLALKTVYNIWKLENQSKNAEKIALAAGQMYDKFVDFREEFLKVGKKLGESQHSYDTAYKRLSEGKGNIIGKIEKIKELGIQNKKNLSETNIFTQNTEQIASDKPENS